jgi:hypothetical protein
MTPLRVGLAHTQMKLGWAYKRLDELKGEVAKFRKDAYTETRKDNAERDRHYVCIEQKATPDAVGMLIGEFAYCLRSSLDNLAWQLALLTTDNPGRTTAFPVESMLPLPTNKSYIDKIADIPATALTIIESLQPYKATPSFQDHPLWKLNRLCNIDKHRAVAVGHIAFSIGIFNVSQAWWDGSTFQHAVIVSVPLSEKDKLQLNVDVPGIVFGEPIDRTDGTSDLEIDLDGLTAIYNFTRQDVVPRFSGLFP